MLKEDIETNALFIQKKIKSVAVRAARLPQKIKLIAVTKNVSVLSIVAAINGSIKSFGENKIQEAITKIEDLGRYDKLDWHFIGKLQSNKAKYAVKYFNMIHSVDSKKLAYEINKEAEKIKKVQKILIQVNIGKEKTKSGVEEENLEKLLKAISTLKNISVEGLMAIPPPYENKERMRVYFIKMQRLKNKMNSLKIRNINMAELSMGMSNDFDVAIEEGATFVRIGTAIFGDRVGKG